MVLRVFLVEDNPAMCAYLRAALTSDAEVCLVGTAETETQAKDWLQHSGGQWDLALVDLCLKEGSGAGVVDFCRERRDDQALLVMTNHDELPLLNRCKLLGADAVFSKNVDLDDLLAYCIGMAVESEDRMVWP